MDTVTEEPRYIVEFLEHYGMPWRCDGMFTRAGAWKRIKMCAADIVPGWAYPVWARIYDENNALIYSCDMVDLKI